MLGISNFLSFDWWLFSFFLEYGFILSKISSLFASAEFPSRVKIFSATIFVNGIILKESLSLN